MRQNNRDERLKARASPLSDGRNGCAINTRASPISDEKSKRKDTAPMLELRIATWNIGTMTGRSAELSAILERRRINICCVQETKWKGAKSRQIGKGFKLLYNGKENTRNGIGIILDQYLSNNVVEISRISDRIMSVKLALDKQPCLNVVSVYAPQVNCPDIEKLKFWEELQTHLTTIPTGEQKIICGDLNGHVGMDGDGYEGYHGGFGYGEQNKEGETILEFAASHNLAVVNTFFQKKNEHLITYKSGNSKTQIDYFLLDKRDLKHIKDCKVIPGEPLTSQHRLLLTALKLKNSMKTKLPKVEKIKWHALKGEKSSAVRKQVVDYICKNPFQNENPSVTWKNFETFCIATVKHELGISKGALHSAKDTKWWNNCTKDSVANKKRLFKIWQNTGSNEDKENYKQAKKTARVTVAVERDKADSDFYKQLELTTSNDIYKVARRRHNDTKDFKTTKYIKNREGTLLTNDKDICERWYEYYQYLLNEEFPRHQEAELPPTEGPISEITPAEVRKAISKMKNHKATGPDHVPAELWKLLETDGEIWLSCLFNRILDDGEMPDAWRKSTLVPFYKNKGDVRDCGNFRGIKLTSHTLKIWERVLSERLQSLVNFTENQFGFIAGKGTTEAIHAIRLLIEKARENKQTLWMIFIDLEKAFDRVPRTLIWQALRSQNVPERYIKLITDMYRNVQTSVRSPAGVSKSFDIEVGVHQGSALSPLLFNTIMNYLTERIQKPLPWNLLYADDVALISDNEQEAQDSLDHWRRSLEPNGLRISRTKTEYMVLNFSADKSSTTHTELKLDGEILPRVNKFKYLGSVIAEDGTITADITHRITSGWNKWRELTGVLCDPKMPIKTKGKVYKTAVRPVLLYGSETWATKQIHEQKLHTTEMRMLRWAGGVTLKDKVRNEYIRGTFKVAPVTEKLKESRLRWFGHVMRRPENHVVKKCLSMAAAKGGRGRPVTTWLTNVRRDMKELGLSSDDAYQRSKWRLKIRKADPA